MFYWHSVDLVLDFGVLAGNVWQFPIDFIFALCALIGVTVLVCFREYTLDEIIRITIFTEDVFTKSLASTFLSSSVVNFCDRL